MSWTWLGRCSYMLVGEMSASNRVRREQATAGWGGLERGSIARTLGEEARGGGFG
jgi:hypothetical protein